MSRTITVIVVLCTTTQETEVLDTGLDTYLEKGFPNYEHRDLSPDHMDNGIIEPGK